jgi:SAM-dependent methyltransferase
MPQSEYERKIRQELETYQDKTTVHDLPAIFHYWFNRHVGPLCRQAGILGVEEYFASHLLQSAAHTGSARPRFLSVGSGNCDTEVAVAVLLRQRGCRDFTVECLEINPAMLQRGRQMAAEQQVEPHLRFTEADFNTWTAGSFYDGVMANQSLHHVTALEHLFDQLKWALHTGARFVISDVIGRNGHQRWPESLEIVQRFWRELPAGHRYNRLLQRHEETYDNWDCSAEGFEGVRAQDILPLLLREFHYEKFVAFGSAIDVFVDRAFGHHFDPASQTDRDFIDRVHQADEDGFASRTLTPTHMFGVFAREPVASPHVARGLTPEAAVRPAEPQ